MRNLNLLRALSVPLVVGVFVALTWAHVNPEQYHAFLHVPAVAGLPLHFLTNDLFMTLCFAMAAVEITQSCLPGGDLHPPKRAMNRLLAIDVAEKPTGSQLRRYFRPPSSHEGATQRSPSRGGTGWGWGSAQDQKATAKSPLSPLRKGGDVRPVFQERA